MNTQNDNKDDLLPCPFCLSKAKRVNGIYVKDVECTVCKAIAPTAIWNNRPNPPVDSEMVEKLCRAYMVATHPSFKPDGVFFEGGEPHWKLYEEGIKAILAALSNGSATGEGVDEHTYFEVLGIIGDEISKLTGSCDGFVLSKAVDRIRSYLRVPMRESKSLPTHYEEVLRVARDALERIQSDAEYCYGKPYDYTDRLGKIAKDASAKLDTLLGVPKQ